MFPFLSCSVPFHSFPSFHSPSYSRNIWFFPCRERKFQIEKPIFMFSAPMTEFQHFLLRNSYYSRFWILSFPFLMAEPSFHLLDRKQSSRISFSWIKGAKHVIELIASWWNEVVFQSIWAAASGTKAAPLSMVKIDEGIRVSFELVCMRSRVKDLIRIMTDWTFEKPGAWNE